LQLRMLVSQRHRRRKCSDMLGGATGWAAPLHSERCPTNFGRVPHFRRNAAPHGSELVPHLRRNAAPVRPEWPSIRKTR
jgi:hypothetical protein